MIGVDKIDDIRRLGRGGASVASIARDTGVSEPTVRKYLIPSTFFSPIAQMNRHRSR